MAGEKEKLDTGLITDIFIQAHYLIEHYETTFYPYINIESVYDVCNVCGEMLYKIKAYAPEIWETYFCGFAELDFPEDFKLSMHDRKASNVFRLWGHVIDISVTMIKNVNLSVYYREILASLTKKDGKCFKEFKDKEWWRFTKEWLQEFYDYTICVLGCVTNNVGSWLKKVDVNIDPKPRLALVERILLRMEYEFFRCSEAIGPYMPSEEDWPPSFWNDGSVDIELGSQQGILKTQIIARRTVRCIFNPDGENSTPIEWRLEGWSEEIEGFNRESYRTQIFDTWNYTTGKFLGQWQTDKRAYWFVNDEVTLDRWAEDAIELSLPLFRNSNYEKLAEKIIKIVKNNKPEWRIGEVQWSYVAELDGIIQECRLARKIYQTKEVKSGSDIENIKTPEQTIKTIEEIPAEHKSPPMSLKEMAGYFGESVKVPKISAMMRIGCIRYEKITRESYFFDLRSLPEYVQNKIKERMR